MSKYQLELCCAIVKEYYGDIVEKVALFIVKKGSLPLRVIVKGTGLSVKQVSTLLSPIVYYHHGYMVNRELPGAATPGRTSPSR